MKIDDDHPSSLEITCCVFNHLVANDRNIRIRIWKIRSEEKAGILEALKALGQIGFGAGLQAAIIGTKYA